MSTYQQRDRIAKAIVSFEARRDGRGRLQVYGLPRGDGGGTPAPGYPQGYEIAGICNKYHPHEAADLRHLVEEGHHLEAEERAEDYIAAYTDAAAVWIPKEVALEAYLRDCVFNRGPRGAARILQLALGVDPDGRVGPVTRSTLATTLQHFGPAVLLDRLNSARQTHERRFCGRNEKSEFWKGLSTNRWPSALAMARGFLPAAKGSE